MSAVRPVPLDAIDQLDQIRDELRVIWLALTNADQAEGYIVEIGEAVNGVTRRLAETCKLMEAQP